MYRSTLLWLVCAASLLGVSACDDCSIGSSDEKSSPDKANERAQQQAPDEPEQLPEKKSVGPPGWRITLVGDDETIELEGEVVLDIIQDGVTPKEPSKFILKLSNPKGTGEQDSARFILPEVGVGDTGLYNTSTAALFSDTHELECEPTDQISVDLRTFTERTLVGTLSGKVTCGKKTYEMEGEFRE